MKLYVDPGSSSSLRILAYANFKGIAAEPVVVSLREGQHVAGAYAALNPSRSVPALDPGDGNLITQSLAMMELLEVWFPQPAALPVSPLAQAKVRSLCCLVACDIHPLTNMRVRHALSTAGYGNDKAGAWCSMWTRQGLQTLEAWFAQYAGKYSFGDDISFADFFVAPMILNARRFGCEIEEFPRANWIYANCLAHPAFLSISAANAQVGQNVAALCPERENTNRAAPATRLVEEKK